MCWLSLMNAIQAEPKRCSSIASFDSTQKPNAGLSSARNSPFPNRIQWHAKPNNNISKTQNL